MSNKQLSYAPADMWPMYCGKAFPLMREIDDTFKEMIMLLCYESPKSISELSEALQTGYEYVQSAARELCELKVMKKQEGGKYLTLIPMFHLRKNLEATSVKYKTLWELEIPKKINDSLCSLKDKINSLDFYGHDFDIKYLNWFLYILVDRIMWDTILSYFSSKTDEIIVDRDKAITEHYDASAFLTYQYADENVKEEFEKAEKRIEKWSTYYMHHGEIQVNNVFDAAPFPDGYDEKTHYKDFSKGRNGYITNDNLQLYLKLVREKDYAPSETEQKTVDEFLEHGVIIKENGKYKPMIPVFNNDSFAELKKMISKTVIPIAKEIAETIGTKIEEILLPCLYDVKERKDHFYCFWISHFLGPREELFWYGMNVDGLEIPEDYNKSVVGIYIVA